MYRSILVPLDGSPFAEYAVPAALAIARRAGGVIHLVHVHERLLIAETVDPVDRQVARREEAEYLSAVEARAAADGEVGVDAHLLRGAVVPKLLGQARRCGADLVVMTTHGRGGLSRLWLGSTADELLRRSELPVLLIRPGEERPPVEDEPSFHDVLVPLDGSPLAEQILPYAIGIARLFGGRLTLLRVARAGPSFGYPSVPLGVPLEPVDAVEAKGYLDRVADRLRGEGLEAGTLVARNPVPARAIAEYAEANAVDLIALATHGRGGLSRLVLGSTADKVIRGCMVPVLVYRPRPERPVAQGAEEGLETRL